MVPLLLIAARRKNTGGFDDLAMTLVSLLIAIVITSAIAFPVLYFTAKADATAPRESFETTMVIEEFDIPYKTTLSKHIVLTSSNGDKMYQSIDDGTYELLSSHVGEKVIVSGNYVSRHFVCWDWTETEILSYTPIPANIEAE